MPGFAGQELEIPALRVGDQKVAKRLHARDRLEFFRIDEVGVERDRIASENSPTRPPLPSTR